MVGNVAGVVNAWMASSELAKSIHYEQQRRQLCLRVMLYTIEECIRDCSAWVNNKTCPS